MMVPIIYSCWLILITQIKGEQDPHSLWKMKQIQTAKILKYTSACFQKAQLAPFNFAISSYTAEIRMDVEQWKW